MKTSDISDAIVVRACWDAPRALHLTRAIDLLKERTGAPEKVCFSALSRAHRRGLIDYGVSLATAWLTAEGEQLLREDG